MKRFGLIPIIIGFGIVYTLCFNISLNAQTTPEVANKFINFSLESDALQLKARLFVPDPYSEQEVYPVVVTLHGKGQNGDDNYKQVRANFLATTWGFDYFQEMHPCFIFSPQCPIGSNWSTPKVFQSVMALLDTLTSSYPIDINRIYLTGLSLGGMGTWSYLRSKPDLFAAAVPVCGGVWGSDKDFMDHVNLTRHIPVWNWHGKEDDLVDVSASRNIFNRYPRFMEFPLYTHHFYREEYNLEVSEINQYIDDYAEIIYSELPNVEHDAWNYAYRANPEVKRWLFKQRKHGRDHVLISKQDTSIKVSGIHEFTFTTSTFVDSISVWSGHVNSPDWDFIEMIEASSGSYLFETHILSDRPRVLLKFIAHDTAGHAIGKDYTDVLTIDNEGNAPPYIELLEDLSQKLSSIDRDYYKMKLFLGDPESDPLQLAFSVSYDNGRIFEAYAESDAREGIVEKDFNLRELYRSDSMVLRAEVTDGEHMATVQTFFFTNESGVPTSSTSLMTDNFKIFPNPAQKLITIRTAVSGPHSIEISTLSGQVVLTDEVDGHTHQMDLSSLERSVYCITIRSKDFVFTRKIIKL